MICFVWSFVTGRNLTTTTMIVYPPSLLTGVYSSNPSRLPLYHVLSLSAPSTRPCDYFCKSSLTGELLCAYQYHIHTIINSLCLYVPNIKVATKRCLALTKADSKLNKKLLLTINGYGPVALGFRFVLQN